ncbi:hypothetical protein BOTBODRAFT_27051 [Botryobasidium botryosum FD-172 SS1]|uniref:Uncharacterized protein n=1 Tax=Botryobasidium botryosum (strain FD-172 SS1) TaxID=930990 RepID=A0A067NA72_BOTB1|nr:hypothetical protein BOTBODRAFT_27051 [Botryobasidium botryosum FD-172 SS1]
MKVVYHIIDEGIASDVFVYVSMCWINVFQVLARDREEARRRNCQERVDALASDLKALLHVFRLHATNFPTASTSRDLIPCHTNPE